jgi:hypothetical protein
MALRSKRSWRLTLFDTLADRRVNVSTAVNRWWTYLNAGSSLFHQDEAYHKSCDLFIISLKVSNTTCNDHGLLGASHVAAASFRCP